MRDAVVRAAEGLAALCGRQPASRLQFVLSPYRICPLGAHVDHQDGRVTGMAIDHGVIVAFAARDDGLVRAASADFPGETVFALHAVPPAVPDDWGNYPRGAAATLGKARRLRRGADLFLVGQLPVGGLSSSAAVGVGCLLALEAVNELDITPEANVARARAIENDYIGLHSGVLDQSMILFARQDRLLRLDCRTGEREYVAFAASPGATEGAEGAEEAKGGVAGRAPLPLAIGIAYSGLSQALAGTGYNRRVAECQEAATRLLALAGETAGETAGQTANAEAGSDRLGAPRGVHRSPLLRDVPPAVYERQRAALPAGLARRAAHYFGEQARVAEGTAAWARGDFRRFGQLVSASGRSSITNYECGAPELVALYEALISHPDVYGARFSGAGFRGSCLALVKPAAFEAVARRVRDTYLSVYPQYTQRFGFFRCASGPGARLLTGTEA